MKIESQCLHLRFSFIQENKRFVSRFRKVVDVFDPPRCVRDFNYQSRRWRLLIEFREETMAIVAFGDEDAAVVVSGYLLEVTYEGGFSFIYSLP